MNSKLMTGLACAAMMSACMSVANAKALYFIADVPSTADGGIDSGVSFNAGQTVSVKAQGLITVTSVQPEPAKPQADGSEGYFTPDGALGPDGSGTAPDCQLGQLIGTISGTGVWHCLGKKASFVADGTGDLILAINDWPGNYSDNLGDFDVLIEAP
ncbi:MAG TPA: LecA/PA-IL family lectin [Rhizomicrobium sp.]